MDAPDAGAHRLNTDTSRYHDSVDDMTEPVADEDRFALRFDDTADDEDGQHA